MIAPFSPFTPEEAIGTAEAARLAGISQRMMREWCCLHRIGRRIGGHWKVSRVALRMFLDGDEAALNAYISGDRASELVLKYYADLGISSPAL